MPVDVDAIHQEVVHLREVMGERDLRYEARFIASERAVTITLQALKEAADKAEKSAVDRHGDLFRQLNRTADVLTEKITTLALRYEGTQGGSSGMERAWGYLIAVVGVGAAVISATLR